MYNDYVSCPHYAKSIFGNEISVCIFGAIPFIYYNPIRGSDLNVAKILAKKYGFNMKLSPARTPSELMQRVRTEF